MNTTTNIILSVIAIAVVIIAAINVYSWNQQQQEKKFVQDTITKVKEQEEQKQLERLGATGEAAQCFTELMRNNTDKRDAMERCKVFPEPNPQGDCLSAMIKNNTDAAIGVPRCLAYEEEVKDAIDSARKDCLDDIPDEIKSKNQTAINECVEKSWEVYKPPLSIDNRTA